MRTWMSRREVMGQLMRGGGAAWLSRGLPLGAAATVLGWGREARAAALPLDPVPDPIAAGWVKEGQESFAVGAPLVLQDADPIPIPGIDKPYINFIARPDDTAFAGDIVLSPFVAIDAGYIIDGDLSTGVHVTINDGARELKAALLQNGVTLKVSLKTSGGFSAGIDLGGNIASFQLRRLANGDGVITAGSVSQTIAAIDLPGTARVDPVTGISVKTIEFGTYDTSAASVSRWNTLGLPKAQVPFATFQARADVAIRAGAHNDAFDAEALFTLGAGSNGLNPLTEDVTLTLGSGVWAIPAGSFHAQRGGWFAFRGTVGTTRLGVAITPLPGGRYGFGALGAGADLAGVANPVPVGLTIGDDTGHAEVLARFVP